jgi:DNA-directed RNA polymerase subunit E'/Rpb7
LQAPSEYRPKFKQWIWKFSEDEANPVEFVIQTGDKIRIRIRSITFAALTSTVKGTTATVTEVSNAKTLPEEESALVPQAIRKRSTSFDVDANTEPPAAMQIIGSINEDGLGLPAWWE